MALAFYNTLGRKKEPFSPIEKGEVRMYNCGPTVYHYAHIGNMRAYVFADLLRRWLEYKGFAVTQVMNLTDVGHMVNDAEAGEDKMEKASKREGKTPEEIADFYANAFFKDLDTLNIQRATHYPRATEYVQEMIKLVQLLLDNGHAYVEKGSVYYDVESFTEYGKLSGNTIEKLRAGARVPVCGEKKNPEDFALWINKPEHVMKWPAPWSTGYPGWHVECSAMAMKLLGPQIDIHTGGDDNKFPHHEDEIAQSEGATGQAPFARYWMHVGPLKIDGEKMSKSKGNFFTVSDLLAKGHNWRAIRYLLISSHYRQELNLTEESLEAAGSAVARLRGFVKNMDTADGAEWFSDEIDAARKKIDEALSDDLAMPEALATLFELIKAMNKTEPATPSAMEAKALVLDVDRILGLELEEMIEIPEEVRELADLREMARKNKEWAEADVLRDDIGARGWIVEDDESGYVLKPKE